MMFVPRDYRAPDPEWVTELVRGEPLAILATSVAGSCPMATHVPTVPEAELTAGLVGSSILGHMNRLNPHWRRVERGGPALLIFQGPDGYVSPTVYEVSPAAPTWNFTSVHARGSLRAIRDRDETFEVIRQTVKAYENSHGTGWDMSGSLGYFRQILPGVGAFRFLVEEVDSMFKLSQEQPGKVWQRAVDAFSRGHQPGQRCLAELMRRAR